MRWFSMCFLVFLCSLLFVVAVFGEADEATAAAAISETEDSMVSAFEAVLEVETVGADVSDFLGRLNHLGGLLGSAVMFYRNGNYSGAVLYAGLAGEGLEELETEAVSVANSVGAERGQIVSWIVAGSVVGVFVVLLGGVLGWSYVRELYVGKLLKMKPEVKEEDDEY